jgi:hypothetical protein
MGPDEHFDGAGVAGLALRHQLLRVYVYQPVI